MITAVKAYYNGSNFVTFEDYKFKPQQQVLIVVDDDLQFEESNIESFLKLSWAGSESADEIIESIESDRKDSLRFEDKNALFN